MSQGLRDMLANRKFAIPLIVLLAFCLVGLILVGIVLLIRPGAEDEGTPVAQATFTSEPTTRPTSTPIPIDSPTPRPTPTLVPLGTPVDSGAGGTPVAPATGEASPSATAGVTAQATSTGSTAATATPQTDEELADTGVGWGLIVFSAAGLGALALAARRLRLAR